VLGIAYRRHVARSFWMRPLAWMFYLTFAVAALWHAPRAADRLLAKFAAVSPSVVLAADAWWQHDWATLPAQRNETDVRRRWPLDVQIAGPLEPLRKTLEARGWRVQPQANWVTTLGLLDDDMPPREQVVLPATLDAQAETLLLLHDGANADEQLALRLWPAPATLSDGTPLWMGTAQTLRINHPLGVAALWLPVADDGRAHLAVREALAGFTIEEASHPHGGVVLRLRTR